MEGKKIVVGLTGGIAAYKIPQLIRDLKRSGADVRAVITESAAEFVTPLTLSTVTGREAIVGTFNPARAGFPSAGTWHIELAQWADLMLIAPATANTVAKIAHGYADNAVTTLALAARCPVILSPSMDSDMWLRETTQKNVAVLRELGYLILPPPEGELASGLSGPGRLPDIPLILDAVDSILNLQHRDLGGKRVLVSAGPTYEPIDPVRYIGNRSSGKMGFAIANAAVHRGADVTLVSGPVRLRTPRNVKRIDVQTAAGMYDAMTKERRKKDIILMAAAVADFTPEAVLTRKIKKEDAADGGITVRLKKTKDVLKSLGEKKGKSVLIGFAVETGNETANARKKLKEKNLDLIIVNNPLRSGAGFDTDTNIVTIIPKSGKPERLKKMSKYEVAHEILNRAVRLL